MVRSGFSRTGGTGARSRISRKMTPELASRNDNDPVAISLSNAPNENRSVRASNSLAAPVQATYKRQHPPRTGCGHLRQPKIQNLGGHVWSQDICGLSVSVDNVFRREPRPTHPRSRWLVTARFPMPAVEPRSSASESALRGTL